MDWIDYWCFVLAVTQCTSICLSNWEKILEHSHRIHDSV